MLSNVLHWLIQLFWQEVNSIKMHWWIEHVKSQEGCGNVENMAYQLADVFLHSVCAAVGLIDCSIFSTMLLCQNCTFFNVPIFRKVTKSYRYMYSASRSNKGVWTRRCFLCECIMGIGGMSHVVRLKSLGILWNILVLGSAESKCTLLEMIFAGKWEGLWLGVRFPHVENIWSFPSGFGPSRTFGSTES